MRISDWSSDVCSSDLARFDDEPAFEAGADDRLSAVPGFHVQPAHHAASARRKAMLVRNPFQPSAQIIATPPDILYKGAVAPEVSKGSRGCVERMIVAPDGDRKSPSLNPSH